MSLLHAELYRLVFPAFTEFWHVVASMAFIFKCRLDCMSMAAFLPDLRDTMSAAAGADGYILSSLQLCSQVPWRCNTPFNPVVNSLDCSCDAEAFGLVGSGYCVIGAFLFESLKGCYLRATAWWAMCA